MTTAPSGVINQGMKATDTQDTSPATTEQLPDLACLATSRFRLIGFTGLAFLILAAIATSIKGPTFEATAFLEIQDAAEIPTIEEKLRFPSLYRSLTESDDAARDLAQRTVVKNRRGSQLVAVMVRHHEPENAASEANAIADKFVDGQVDALHEAAEQLRAQTALASRVSAKAAEPDSLQSLAATWKSVSAELETLSKRYENEASHPAVIGATERRDKVAQRIREQIDQPNLRETLDLDDPNESSDLGAQLDAIVNRLAEIQKNAEASQSRLRELDAQAKRLETLPSEAPVSLAEAAVIPLSPAGPSRVMIWGAALVMGAFVGFLLALCGCCRGGACKQ